MLNNGDGGERGIYRVARLAILLLTVLFFAASAGFGWVAHALIGCRP